MILDVSIHLMGSNCLRLDWVPKGTEAVGTASWRRSLAGSAVVISLRRLVELTGVIESGLNAGGGGVRGHFGQWGAYAISPPLSLPSSDLSSSGVMMAGSTGSADVAPVAGVDEADGLGENFDWT